MINELMLLQQGGGKRRKLSVLDKEYSSYDL